MALLHLLDRFAPIQKSKPESMKVTPNSSPPPNDEGEYEPISKTEDTGDQLIGKFQNKSL